MLAKFYNNNIFTGFIKSFLSSIYLPMYNTIREGDKGQKDCCYLYKDKLIKFNENVNNFKFSDNSIIFKIKENVHRGYLVIDNNYDIAKPLNTQTDAYMCTDYIFIKRGQTVKYTLPSNDSNTVLVGIFNLDEKPIKKHNYQTKVDCISLGNGYYSGTYTAISDCYIVLSYPWYYEGNWDYRPGNEIEVSFSKYSIIENFPHYLDDENIYPTLETPFIKYNTNYSKFFTNTSNYYDINTHLYLGNYLRCLRDIYGLDLMPFYNCYSDKIVKNLSLYVDSNFKVKLSDKSNDLYKIIAVPIKFNKQYTIAIDCPTQVLIKPIFYNDSLLYFPYDIKDKIYLDNYLKDKGEVILSSLQFNSSYVYPGISADLDDFEEYLSANNVSNDFLYNLEKYLYLLIQVPISNESSISIIEGNYNSSSCEKGINLGDILDNWFEKYEPMHLDDLKNLSNEGIDNILNKNLISDLELLEVNDNNIYAFSDRLLEYLTLNVINPLDTIEENINNLQRSLDKEVTSVWTSDIRYILYSKYFNLLQNNDLLQTTKNQLNKYKISQKDITGFVDKDIEKMISTELFDRKV